MNNHKSFEEKLKFISEKVEDLKSINPYVDIKAVDRIKKILCEAGYSSRQNIQDTVVIKLIAVAQGLPFKKNYVSPMRLKR